MPERDWQELSLIPYGFRPLSSALSCGSATPYPYPSNEIASTLFIHVPRSKTSASPASPRSGRHWPATTLAMSRRYPGARPPLGDLLEEGKKAGTRAKDGQPKKRTVRTQGRFFSATTADARPTRPDAKRSIGMLEARGAEAKKRKAGP